jgi:hypothetical protein
MSRVQGSEDHCQANSSTAKRSRRSAKVRIEKVATS